MLRFIFTRHKLPIIQTDLSTPFELLSTQAYKGKVIPFSHIYITTDPYFRKIKKSLGKEYASKLVKVSQKDAKSVQEKDGFPKELSQFNSVDELKTALGDKKKINIVVVNGVGTAFGDNYVGLGAMQRLSKLLAPIKVTFHLMQGMNDRIAPVYMREENVLLHNYIMSVRKFMSMDFYLNLSGMLGFPEFEEKSLSQFMAYKFLIDKGSSQDQLNADLKLDKIKTKVMSSALHTYFQGQDRPRLLFHPKASAPIRTMNKKVADSFIKAFIEQGFNVVIAIPYDYPSSSHVYHMDDLSKSIDDMLHIAHACDAAVSVGTVLYHLTAAMNKPTILLPTVRADVESAKLLKSVTAWVPEESAKLILNKHKGRDEEDMKTAAKIWKNMDRQEIAKTLWNEVSGDAIY